MCIRDRYYKVSTGPLTTINQFELTSNDSIINQQVDKLKERIFIKSGNAFDSDLLKLQRNSLTSYLQNNGFYTFNKEFIYYKIDSANLDRKVDITMGIQNYKKVNEDNNLFELPHNQYYLNQVNVKINKSLISQEWGCRDTTTSKSLNILNCQPIIYQKRLLKNAITFKNEELYQKSDAIETYKRLISLGLFKSVHLSFDTINQNQLNAQID